MHQLFHFDIGFFEFMWLDRNAYILKGIFLTLCMLLDRIVYTLYSLFGLHMVFLRESLFLIGREIGQLYCNNAFSPFVLSEVYLVISRFRISSTQVDFSFLLIKLLSQKIN